MSRSMQHASRNNVVEAGETFSFVPAILAGAGRPSLRKQVLI